MLTANFKQLFTINIGMSLRYRARPILFIIDKVRHESGPRQIA